MRALCCRLLGMLGLFSMLLFIGCEGDDHHDVFTGANGSLAGLTFSPPPQTLGIDVDEVFQLDWPAGYTPPTQFRVKLERLEADGNTEEIFTELHTITASHYRLEPTADLPNRTFVLLTVSASGQSVHAIYLTERGSLLLQSPARSTEGHLVTPPTPTP
jgi:hypothetical protein